MTRKTPKPSDVRDFLPLSAQDFQVLLVLAEGPTHGYAIVQAASVAFPGEPALEIGSLYRIVSRMLADGLIEETAPPEDRPRDGRARRFYRTTRFGVRVARAEASRLRAILGSTLATRLREH